MNLKIYLLEAFVQFSKKVSNELIVAYGLPISGLTYGIEVAADYKAFNLKITEKGYRFDLTTPNREFKDIFFNQMGIHNVSNALGALAMADQAGDRYKQITFSLRKLSWCLSENEFI